MVAVPGHSGTKSPDRPLESACALSHRSGQFCS